MERRGLPAQISMLILMAGFGVAWGQEAARESANEPLTVAASRGIIQALDEAQRQIERKQYTVAIQLLQMLLERPEDEIVLRDFDPGKADGPGSKSQALRLLMSMPREGRDAYEVEYGSTARNLLNDAIKDDNLEDVADVARRFALTSAGLDSIVLLAAHASDRGEPLRAAILLESLHDHPAITPYILLKTAACWMQAGQTARCLPLLSEFKSLNRGSKIRIRGQDVSLFDRPEVALDWLTKVAGKPLSSGLEQTTAWTIPGGGASRNQVASPASPIGGGRWHVSTLEHLKLDGRKEVDDQFKARLQNLLTGAARSLKTDNLPLIPAAQPLVIGDIVVYRTLADVTAVRLQTGELLWRSAFVDEALVRLLNSRNFETRLRTGRIMNLGAWSLDNHIKRRAYRDVTAGTLSSDGQTVFGLEELDTSAMGAYYGQVDSRYANKLVAYDLAGGKMLWEVGGPRGTKPIELSSLYFLGPPLPLDGRLYVLAESQGALKLLVLEQDSDRQSVQILWSQTLIATGPMQGWQSLRRLSGLSPSYAQGILVCPTSSGAVVAVDLDRRAVLWGHHYRSMESLQNPAFAYSRPVSQDELDEAARWIDSNPVIAEGRALITGRDSDQLFCLDLATGREIWNLPRGERLSVAGVIDSRVVLLGRHGLEAVELADGKPVTDFKLTEIEPAGRGVRCGRSYCLPTADNEIATIDLRTGKVLARSKLAGGHIPGNLVAGSGTIVSQSDREIVAFLPMSIEDKIGHELEMDPQQPAALAIRGELRLHRGQTQEGLDDLRASLKKRPDAYVKSVIASALLSELRVNPAAVRDHVKELEDVADDPQQKNVFLRLYARALEDQGDRQGTVTQLIRLAETSRFLNNIESIGPGHSVRLDRMIRAHLVDLYARASAGEQREFDRIVKQRISEIGMGEEPLARLERSLKFFTGLPSAETWLLSSLLDLQKTADRDEWDDLLKSFVRSSNPTVAARATAARCRELIGSGKFQDALPCLKRLRDEFADIECLDGQTGQSLFNEWSATDGMKPLLNVPSVWAGSILPVQRSVRPPTIPRASVPAEVMSRVGTTMAGWSFEVDSFHSLHARDAEGRLQWKLAVTDSVTTDGNWSQPQSAQIYIMDNWVVASLNSHFLVIDAESNPPKVVWRQALRSGDETAAAPRPMFRVVPNRGVIRLSPPTQQSSAQVIGLSRETVVYSMGSKLFGADLETGHLAWSRQDVLSGSVEASVDDRAVVIQNIGSAELNVLRTLDGTSITKFTLSPGDESLWVRGAKQLALRNSNSLLEMRDVERKATLWSRECPSGAVTTVIENEDVAILAPNGMLSVIRLSDGRERIQSQLPVRLTAREKSWVAVQRWSEHDIVLCGEATKEKHGVQVFPFDSTGGQSFVYDGYVCAVSRTDGRLLWSTAVSQMSYDRNQPSGLPVLLMASRQYERDLTGTRPFVQFRMVASLIDKRNGQVKYSTEEASPSVAPRLEPDPEHRKIIANFQTWQLDVTFSDPDAKP